MGKEQLLITLPQRGLKIIPPEETREKMRDARDGKIVHFSEEEKFRLQRLIHCAILAKRHPTPEAGREYMQLVDYEWREELLSMAEELTLTITQKWHEINPDQPVSVLLYGSVAKGLVKRPDYPDPSNIDIAVIGVISDEEKLQLFDQIRPARAAVQQRILTHIPLLESPEKNPGNAGVIIQDVEKITKGNYAEAKSYVTAGAFALYDPIHLWRDIEVAAIQSALNPQAKNGH